MPYNAYIHIPFCKSKCKYCSFVSYCTTEYTDRYILALETEIEQKYNGELLKTLYFGGGTPSLLSSEKLIRILSKFNLSNDCEVTLELNPDDSDLNRLQKLKQSGFNRLSIGSQSFNDDILKLIGRRHNAKQICRAVTDAKKAGFENISLDLIYGLPTQTLEDIKLDLSKILDLGIQHISTYGLKIEENSYWGKHTPNKLPDDDIQADMYEQINDILENNLYKRYEVSNFAIEGYESQHNLSYWNNKEYYGFGVASHGYENGIRYYNTSDLEKYIKNPLEHEYSKLLSNKEKLEEEIFLGFRKSCGIDVNIINKKYNIDFDKKYSNILSKYNEFIEKTDVGYKLNLRGTLISNIILAEFL